MVRILYFWIVWGDLDVLELLGCCGVHVLVVAGLNNRDHVRFSLGLPGLPDNDALAVATARTTASNEKSYCLRPIKL